MIDGQIARQQLALALINVFPPIIKEDLVRSETFIEEFGFETNGQISLSPSNITFDQSEFFNGLSELFKNPHSKVGLSSTNGDKFDLEIEQRDGIDVVYAGSDKIRTELPSFWFLSPNVEFRLAEFARLCPRYNFSGEDYEIWLQKLKVAPLSGSDIDSFIRAMRLNVSGISASIRAAVSSGSSPISTLVPDVSAYYRVLVGYAGGTVTLESYTEEYFRRLVTELIAQNDADAFARALLICPHGRLSALVNFEDSDQSELVAVYDWLASRGDRFSQVAGIEIGLRIVAKCPSIEPLIVQMIQDILRENADEDGRLKLISSIFVFVDGELSRLGILRDWPPFLRRLASLAPASVIERELVSVGVDSSQFSEWAVTGRGNVFYLQSLVDLRLEPRWLPDFADPRHLKAEFISRIANAAESNKNSSFSPALSTILFSSESEGIRSEIKFPFSYFPGPLEGASKSPSELPTELISDLKRPKSEGVLKGKFFAGIVNSALVFDLKPEHASLVMEVLRGANHRLSLDEEPHLTFHLLSGLAIISAVTRMPGLAQDVRLLASVLQRRDNTRIDADNMLRIALIASASCEDLGEWCKLVGEWFSDISFRISEQSEAETMRTHLHSLFRVILQLWATCGKADAALSAVAG